MAEHLLDTDGKKIGVTGLLDTGAVVSAMPIKTWERMGFAREDIIATTSRGVIYIAAKTPITILQIGGRNIWMGLLVVEKLEDSV